MTYLRTMLYLSMAGLLPLSAAQSAEVGQKLGACPLTEFNNNTLPLDFSRYKGKVLYLDFWASWCPPCAKSFPFLNKLHQQYQHDHLQVIGVNLDETPEDAKKFLKKYPAEFAIASDLSRQCAQNIGVAAMPSSYLIDKQGVIRYIHLGFRPGETAELSNKVKQLLAEQAL